MNDVMINGVRYVPESNKPNNHHVKRLSSVLAKECPYLSRSVRDNIVKKFESDKIESNQKSKSVESNPKSESNDNIPQYSKRLFNIKNIKGIDEKGHVLFKKGRRLKSLWTIYQATEIRQWMTHGKLNKDRITKLSEKFGVSTNVVNKLIYNLKNEEFNTWLDIMVSKNVIQKPDEKPNKEDMGWF